MGDYAPIFHWLFHLPVLCHDKYYDFYDSYESFKVCGLNIPVNFEDGWFEMD